MNAFDYLMEKGSPTSLALSCDGQSFSYKDLSEQVNKLAQYLTNQKIIKQERVLLLSDNNFFWICSYLACIKVGAIVAPVPVDLHEEIDELKDLIGAKSIICQAKWTSIINKNQFTNVILDTSCDDSSLIGMAIDQMEAPSNPIASCGVDEQMVAAIMFTSGSSGKNKAVMLSHNNIITNTQDILSVIPLSEEDKALLYLPLSYCFGTSLLHTHLRAGASLHIYQKIFSPAHIYNEIFINKCSVIAGVPSHYQLLINNPPANSDKIASLKYIQQAGGKLHPQSITRLKEIFKDQKLFIMYGQTEATARISILLPGDLDDHLESVGHPLPSLAVKIVDEKGNELAPGKTGEVVVCGPSVALGYWRQSLVASNELDNSQHQYFNGELYTGDIGYLQESGRLCITGRKSLFIKMAGKRISLEKIESELSRCDLVKECAVFPYNHELLGEGINLYLVAHGEFGDQKIQDNIRQYISNEVRKDYQPHQVFFLPGFPRLSSGKIDRQKIAKQTDRSLNDAA
jgi:long-chain acyl-CoA synthetase